MVFRTLPTALAALISVHLQSTDVFAMGLEITGSGGTSATSNASISRVFTLGDNPRFIENDANRWLFVDTITRYGSNFGYHSENTEPGTIESATGTQNFTIVNPGPLPISAVLDYFLELRRVGDADAGVTISLFGTEGASFAVLNSNANLPWTPGRYDSIFGSGGFNGAIAGCVGRSEVGVQQDCANPAEPIFSGSIRADIDPGHSVTSQIDALAISFGSSADATVTIAVTVIPAPPAFPLFAFATAVMALARRKAKTPDVGISRKQSN
jgi:hypothetical protein